MSVRTLPSTSCCMPETSLATNRWWKGAFIRTRWLLGNLSDRWSTRVGLEQQQTKFRREAVWNDGCFLHFPKFCTVDCQLGAGLLLRLLLRCCSGSLPHLTSLRPDWIRTQFESIPGQAAGDGPKVFTLPTQWMTASPRFGGGERKPVGDLTAGLKRCGVNRV